jgi:hypothetical protein
MSLSRSKIFLFSSLSSRLSVDFESPSCFLLSRFCFIAQSCTRPLRLKISTKWHPFLANFRFLSGYSSVSLPHNRSCYPILRAHLSSARSLIPALELVAHPDFPSIFLVCAPAAGGVRFLLRQGISFSACCHCVAHDHFSALLFVSFSSSVLGFQPPDRRR